MAGGGRLKATTLYEDYEGLVEAMIDAYVFRADCEAHGLLEKVERDLRIIDYKEWVRLDGQAQQNSFVDLTHRFSLGSSWKFSLYEDCND